MFLGKVTKFKEEIFTQFGVINKQSTGGANLPPPLLVFCRAFINGIGYDSLTF